MNRTNHPLGPKSETDIVLGPELELVIERIAQPLSAATGRPGSEPLLPLAEVRTVLTQLATAAFSMGRIEGGAAVYSLLKGGPRS